MKVSEDEEDDDGVMKDVSNKRGERRTREESIDMFVCIKMIMRVM